MTKEMCLKCKKELFEYKEDIHPKRFKYLIKRLMNENILGVWRLTNDEGIEISRSYFHPECLQEEYSKMKDRDSHIKFYNKMVEKLT